MGGALGDRRQELVVIGQNLGSSLLRQRLDEALLSAAELAGASLEDPFPVWTVEAGENGAPAGDDAEESELR